MLLSLLLLFYSILVLVVPIFVVLVFVLVSFFLIFFLPTRTKRRDQHGLEEEKKWVGDGREWRWRDGRQGCGGGKRIESEGEQGKRMK